MKFKIPVEIFGCDFGIPFTGGSMKKLILFVLFFCSLIFLNCREDIVVYEAKAGTGDVYITSYPDGADIYLNGDRLGKTTPDSLIDLQAGVYSVRLKLLGYEEETVYVNLQSGQKRFINVTLGSD